MTAFDAALAAIYADDNVAVDGLYTPAGGAAVAVRVILAEPEESDPLFSTGAVVGKRRAEIQVAEIGTCRESDSLALNGETYVVRNPHRSDVDRLLWVMDLEET